MGCNVSVDEFVGGRVHGHLAGAVDEAVGHDGLAVDAREGFRGGVG